MFDEETNFVDAIRKCISGEDGVMPVLRRFYQLNADGNLCVIRRNNSFLIWRLRFDWEASIICEDSQAESDLSFILCALQFLSKDRIIVDTDIVSQLFINTRFALFALSHGNFDCHIARFRFHDIGHLLFHIICKYPMDPEVVDQVYKHLI